MDTPTRTIYIYIYIYIYIASADDLGLGWDIISVLLPVFGLLHHHHADVIGKATF